MEISTELYVIESFLKKEVERNNMKSKEIQGNSMEPFYFKSYDKVVGVAHDVEELEEEIERIGESDPACVNWHLQQGHIVSWLKYLGENALAEMLEGVKDWKEALARIEDYYTIQQKPNRPGKMRMMRRRRNC